MDLQALGLSGCPAQKLPTLFLLYANLTSLFIFHQWTCIISVQAWIGSPGSGFSPWGQESRCCSPAAEPVLPWLWRGRVIPWLWRGHPPHRVEPSPFLLHCLGISITSLLQSGCVTSLGESRTQELTILAASAETRLKTALK